LKFARSPYTAVSAKFLLEFWFVMQGVSIPGSQDDGSCVPACSSEIKNTQHLSNAFRYRRRKFRKVGYIGRKTMRLECRWEHIRIWIYAPTWVHEHHRRHGLQGRLFTTNSNNSTNYTWREVVI